MAISMANGRFFGQVGDLITEKQRRVAAYYLYLPNQHIKKILAFTVSRKKSALSSINFTSQPTD